MLFCGTVFSFWFLWSEAHAHGYNFSLTALTPNIYETEIAQRFLNIEGDSEVEIHVVSILCYFSLSRILYLALSSSMSSPLILLLLENWTPIITIWLVNFLCPWFSVDATFSKGIPKCSIVRTIKPANGNHRFAYFFPPVQLMVGCSTPHCHIMANQKLFDINRGQCFGFYSL